MRSLDIVKLPTFNRYERPVCWANGPMAGHEEPSRVPPPHADQQAVARPKPLWQPWSDSDDVADNDSSSSSKELPTRTKKERRRHERHHELLSTASRARKERAPVDEGPLDMSTGRRAQSPPPYAAAATSSSYPLRYPSPPDYARPSVITSASPAAAGSEIISSGMCDPVIDEHFRRSLGERYTHLFASSSTSSSNHVTENTPKMPSTVNHTGLSVDDHFAKALGETWLKLQSETKEKEASTDSQPGSPIPSQRQQGLPLLT